MSVLFAIYRAEDVCFAKMSETKPVCLRSECKVERIHWLHDILKSKSIIIVTAVDLLEDRAVNRVTGGGGGEGWRTRTMHR